MRFWTETERSADEPLIETENDHNKELLAKAEASQDKSTQCLKRNVAEVYTAIRDLYLSDI
jgi:hypothetical protein